MTAAREVRPEHARLPAARWPSAAEAAASRLFSPLTIGALTSRTRTWVPAMVPWRSNEDGYVTRDVLDWYGRFAEGQPGVLVVEATGIRDVPSGPLLRIGDDRFVPGLRELVEIVRRRSHGNTRLVIQVLDFLAIKRRPDRVVFLRRFLQIAARHRQQLEALRPDLASASEADLRVALIALPHEELLALLTPREARDLEFGYREQVDDVHLPHVRELPRVLPELFASASLRAQAAGFDGVELHFAHAYTLAGFLSRRNERADGYGGSRTGRVRLPIEIVRAVREAVGTNWTVGARILSDEVIEGGSRVEDAAFYATELARAGLDFLSISKGGKFEDAKQPKVGHAAYPYTGPSGHECMPTLSIDAAGPFGRNLPLARSIRSAVRAAGCTTPIVGSGGIATFEQAERALADGDCDFVASARQSLADPDWWRKMELGRGAEVRRCIFTNYCEGLDQQHKQVTCQLWDRNFDADDAYGDNERKGSIARSNDNKRRLLPPPWLKADTRKGP